MAEARRVVIESPEGVQAGQTERDFERTKSVLKDGELVTPKAAGWKIVGYENGEPYEPPKTARGGERETG